MEGGIHYTRRVLQAHLFFGLTNSLTTFQTVINDILRDLVDTSSIANFIEIAMSLEEHDDIVKEVIKRMVENDLYIKMLVEG